MPSINPPMPIPSSVPAEISGLEFIKAAIPSLPFRLASGSHVVRFGIAHSRETTLFGKSEVDQRHNHQQYGNRQQGQRSVVPEVVVEDSRSHVLPDFRLAIGARSSGRYPDGTRSADTDQPG